MVGKYMDIGIPEKIQINKNFQHLQIVRKWFNFKFVFLTLFVIIWDGFLITWYAIAFSHSFQDAFDMMFILFPLLHVSLGIGLTYYVLTGYINKTTIDVDLPEKRFTGSSPVDRFFWERIHRSIHQAGGAC